MTGGPGLCATATPQTPFYKGIILIAGVPYPVYPGAQLLCPRNYVAPPIIGNFWRLNYSQNVRTPTIELSMVVRDKASEALGATFLGYAFARSGDTANDTLIIGAGDGTINDGLIFFNGRIGFQLICAKLDSFQMSSSKGDDLRFVCRFVGTELRPLTGTAAGEVSQGIMTASGISNANVIAASAQWTNVPLMRFQHATWTYGVIGTETAINNFSRWSISFSNQHTPDPSLNGTVWASAQNAGERMASMSALVQAADTYVDNDGVFAPYGGGLPLQMNLRYTGPKSGSTAVLTVPNAMNSSADNLGITQPRVMQPVDYFCIGKDGQTTGPLVLTSSAF